MATIQERLATRMRWWADEGNLGYDWDYPDRWHFWVGGEVDCSSMVISVCRECGLDVGDATYTGNMRVNFTAHGWRWIPGRPSLDTLQVGDVLLRESTHTAMYTAYNLISQASANEWGGASGGASGDQGRPNGIGETNTVQFNPSYPWDGILRYEGPDPDEPKEPERPSKRPEGNEEGGSAGTVWRLYNPYTYEHHFTQDDNEYVTLGNEGWRQEGVAFHVSGTGQRVYRMVNPYTGQHLFTRNLLEAQVLWDTGWEFEGVAWRTDGDTPVWRLFHPEEEGAPARHFLTTSNVEHARLVDGAGWRQEGVAFWAQ